MQKFDRNYKVYFEVGTRKDGELYPEEFVEVSYPFTMTFETNAGINFSNNGNCKVQLYNLPSRVQKLLWKDNWYNTKYILMQLHAGYQDTMPLIFFGFVTQCYSYRNGGSTEYITEIQADDNSLISLFGFANVTFSAGTKAHNLLDALLDEVNGYQLGYITPDLPPLRRDKTFIGQTLDLIGKEYGAYDVFIDKGELNILGENDVIPSDELMVITSESGLLGSPKRADQFFKITMLFEPRARIGQAVELLSDSLPFFNGIYKINAVTHKGTISPVQCGNVTTELTLFLGNAIFNEVQKASQVNKGEPKNIDWQRPVQGGSISSGYGMRMHPTQHKMRLHDGVDIAVPIGTSVVSAASGTVSYTGWNGGYGKYIRIDHGIDSNNNRIESFYAHLSEIKTAPNAYVEKGQEIALSGNTAGVGENGKKMTTGPHLHFGMHKNGKSINPNEYIKF